MAAPTAKPKKPAAAKKPATRRKAAPKAKRKAAPAPEPVALCRRGRPTLYTEQLAEEILDRLSDGETLPRICADPHMPSRRTVMRWADDDPAGFSHRYRRAREMQRDAWADDIVEISDGNAAEPAQNGEKDGAKDRSAVERDRLRVSSRQWLMKVGSPTKYGDRIEQTHRSDAAFMELWKRVGGGAPEGETQ